jgi:hypothetical protein
MNDIEREEMLGILRAVIVTVGDKLPRTDVESAWGLVEAGEPGVALENLCTQLYEYDVSVPTGVLAQLRTIGEAMGLDSGLWEDLTVEPVTPDKP